MHYAARAMGGVTLRQKKREELESKSSHKSDILPPAASKNEVRYIENIFFRLEKRFFHIRGYFSQKL